MKKILLFIVCLSIGLYAEIIPPSSGGGESNTASNLGSGEGAYYQKSGVDLQFKSFTGDTGYIDISSSDTEIQASTHTMKSVIGVDYGTKTYDEYYGYTFYQLYVNDSTGADTGLGTSASPFKTIQKAIDVLPKRIDLDETDFLHIYVAAGTYSYTPYYNDDFDYCGWLAKIEGFYGTGSISIQIATGATLKMEGAYTADITGHIFEIMNNEVGVGISGSGTAKLSYEITGVNSSTYHCAFFYIESSSVGTSNLTLENNNTYESGKTAYTYDYSVHGSSSIKTTDVVYTIGKEGTVSFNQNDNLSTIQTDNKLVGATVLTRTYGTNLYIVDGYDAYQLVRKGLYIYKTGTTPSDVISNETMYLLSTYKQTEAALADAVGKKHEHSNKATLDSIQEALTTALKGNYDTAYSHSGITTGNPHSVSKGDVGLGDVPNLNTTDAVNNQHTHSNKTSLDGIAVFRQVLSTATDTDTPLNLLTGARTTFYDITLTGDCQVETPTFTSGSAQDGDSLIIRVLASGSARTISFLQGGDGTFAYGSTLTSTDITETVQDETDYIGCTYNDAKKRWLVISYSKGF